MDFLKLGIIGHPLTHSLSPLLHANLLQLLGLAGEYRKYDCPPADLDALLPTLAHQQVRGLNVTIPHKVAVMKAMDWLSPEAALAGAVNTIVFSRSEKNPDAKNPDLYTLKSYNTDITGFMRSLPAGVLHDLPQSDLLVLGAGGSARAVMTGLIQAKTASITFAVRDPLKAISITSDGEMVKQTYQSPTQLNLVSLDTLPCLSAFQGLINTTPVGMYPQEAQSPIPAHQLEALPLQAWVYDLIYRPIETRLLSLAKAQGLITANGLDMLIYQGICAFELWSEMNVPAHFTPALRQTLENALQLPSAP
ncbi:shikimate dehydrogenase [Vampirovibrio sp.]|uniref:shikimate dehydrogenase family protein n=1 Tax=Vampirovibrio sp. TaxID=2717857 RepID=UPI003593F151